MPEVSLTTIVDFVSKAGTPKATMVRNCKNQEPYDPRKDYYRQLRMAIQDMHEQGLPLSHLQERLNALDNPRKVGNYTELVSGYHRWARRHHLVYVAPQSETWQCDGLSVRVNPELGLRIDGQLHLIKLSDPLAANRIALIGHLMHLAYEDGTYSNAAKAVLAIRNSRLFLPPVPVEGLTAQLRAEAA